MGPTDLHGEMETAFFLVVAAVTASLAWWKTRRTRAEAWQTLAGEVGLDFTDGDLVGARGDVQVRVSGDNKGTWVRAWQDGVPTDFSARPVPTRPTHGVVETGFDDTVQVQGEPGFVAAALTREMRGWLKDVVRDGGYVDDGTVAVYSRQLVTNKVRLESLITDAVRLARALGQVSMNQPDRLVEIARSDRVPGWRTRALRTLLDQFGAHDAESRELAEAALESDDDGLFTLAALALGRPDRLAAEVDRVPDNLAVRAVAVLRGVPEYREALTLLRQRALPEVKAAAAEALTGMGAGAGQLALVDGTPEAGGLSLAGGGEMSLAEPESDG